MLIFLILIYKNIWILFCDCYIVLIFKVFLIILYFDFCFIILLHNYIMNMNFLFCNEMIFLSRIIWISISNIMKLVNVFIIIYMMYWCNFKKYCAIFKQFVGYEWNFRLIVYLFFLKYYGGGVSWPGEQLGTRWFFCSW